MKHSRSKVFLLLALLSSATTLLGRPQLKNLDIQVVLAHNGDAYITETRTMDIDSEGTECYIVIGNLNGSEVRDLKVSDETGLDYVNLGDWDIDESRSYKAGKCGIVNKRNGYELCWGLGDSGSRTYITIQAIRSQTWSRPSTMPTALTICSLPKASHQVLTTSS